MIFEAVRRTLAFHLFRSPIPRFVGGFDGPVVVVGSAPHQTMPKGFDDHYGVVTVNGSQGVVETWGRIKPSVTIMTGKQLDGENINAVSVRQVLAGKSTGILYVLWRGEMAELAAKLAAISYYYDQLFLLKNSERMEMHYRLLGKLNLERTRDERFSNGLTGVLYALSNGAPSVILSGISPHSTRHVYNSANLTRQHSATDATVLRALVARGYPIFTADQDVSDKIGVPLWPG